MLLCFCLAEAQHKQADPSLERPSLCNGMGSCFDLIARPPT